jgi:hypothetical protein
MKRAGRSVGPGGEADHEAERLVRILRVRRAAKRKGDESEAHGS